MVVPACQAGAGAAIASLAPLGAAVVSGDDVEPGVAAPSELSSGVVLPGLSPDARDGASTRLSTPSSSAPFTDKRLSPSQLSLIRSNQIRSYGFSYDA
jgi:hypothetical protein